MHGKHYLDQSVEQGRNFYKPPPLRLLAVGLLVPSWLTIYVALVLVTLLLQTVIISNSIIYSARSSSMRMIWAADSPKLLQRRKSYGALIAKQQLSPWLKILMPTVSSFWCNIQTWY